MKRRYFRYHFAICAHSLTTLFSYKLNSLLLKPFEQLARRKFLKRKLDFMVCNIGKTIPGKEKSEHDRIANESVDYMWQIFLRHFSRKSKKTHPRKIINETAIDSIVSGTPKGAIVITSHQGDWEDLIQYFRERDDLDSCNLYRKPKCEKAVGFLRKFRGVDQYCTGYSIIKRFKKASSRKVIALIGIDQKPLNKGIYINFLNRPTQISPISVQIALRLQLPIIIAKTLIKNEQNVISFREIDILNTNYSKKKDIERFALQRVMDEIAHDIVEDPEQWLMWAHNFWKPVKKVSNAQKLAHPPHEELFPKKKTSPCFRLKEEKLVSPSHSKT